MNNEIFSSLQDVLKRIYEIKQKFQPSRRRKVMEAQSYSSQTSADKDVRDSDAVTKNQRMTRTMPSKADFAKIIRQAAQKYKVSPDLLSSIIKTESGFNPSARSPKGALGLMQLMPSTAKELGVKDMLNPQENIFGGAKYFRYLLDKYNGDLKLALSAYNAGPGRVDQNKDVPNIRETQEYIRKVLKEYYG